MFGPDLVLANLDQVVFAGGGCLVGYEGEGDVGLEEWGGRAEGYDADCLACKVEDGV